MRKTVKGSDPVGHVRRGGASHPLVELTLARLREFVREPEAIFWTFFFPIVLSIAMAIAFPASGTAPVRVGLEPGPASEPMRQALSASKDITIRDVSAADELRALRDGEIHLVVVPGTPPAYRFDPAREESRVARLVVDEALKRAGGRPEPWTAREDRIAVPGSRYVDWLIPAIISLNIMNNGIWSIGFMTVTARLRKLLKRLAASPMKKREFLMAPMLSRLVFLGPEVAAPLVFVALVFDTPIRGSIINIAGIAVLGAFAFGSIGLLVGSRARTFEAASGLMNATTVPMWVLSGVFFSSSNFPDAVQPVIQALPLTALVDAMRGVILEGATLAGVWHEIAILLAWTLLPFVIALRIFKWR
jgi:ABC-type multidrug transport system permease subunit